MPPDDHMYAPPVADGFAVEGTPLVLPSLAAGARVVLAGSPRAGKTVLADLLDRAGWPVRHTDDLIETHGWSDASREIAEAWLPAPGPWVIEGVSTVRALRKWIAKRPGEKPCECVVWLPTPHVTLSGGQSAMRSGCVTVWKEIREVLKALRVQVLEVP